MDLSHPSRVQIGKKKKGEEDHFSHKRLESREKNRWPGVNLKRCQNRTMMSGGDDGVCSTGAGETDTSVVHDPLQARIQKGFLGRLGRLQSLGG